MREIERKFLVKYFHPDMAVSSDRIVQGYLSSVPERTVRIRTKGDKAYITIKGKGKISRFEWEKKIAVSEAEQLLLLCEPYIIDKTRYYVPFQNHTFEVDIFHGINEGLVVAELELNDENETFETPEWLGEEVTSEEKYYNAVLSKRPYKEW